MVYPNLKNSVKCGCNSTATKRISKTASITSISNLKRPTSLSVWSNIRLIALVLLMTQLLLSMDQVDAMSMRPRQLRKRHSMNDVLNWENPCGGVHLGSHSGEQRQRKASLDLLRKLTKDAFNTIKARNNQWIDTADINDWSAYNNTYKFLPKLRRNSSVALKRWHRNMQTFVASFSYLHNKSRKYDEARLNNHESNHSKELQFLLYYARDILCEIESSINRTTPFNRGRKLTSHIAPEVMSKRLKFRTKTLASENGYQVDDIDLKFVKFYFTEFLSNMLHILKHNKNRVYLGSKSQSTNDSTYLSANSKQESSNEINASMTPRRSGKKNRHGRKRNQKHLRISLQNVTPSIA